MNNLKQALTSSKFEFIKGDIRNSDEIGPIVSKVDVIVNFAAESHVDRSITSSHEFITTNILGTSKLLEASLENDIQLFLQISTDEVYGSIAKGSAKEDFQINPSSVYSASKASADLLVLSYAHTHNLPVLITRSSNNFGPRQNLEKMIPNFIDKFKNNSDVPIYGTGNQIRNWIYVEENVRLIADIMRKGRNNETYNIGSQIEITNLEVAKIIAKKMKKSEKLIKHVTDRKGHDFRYSLDSTKIIKELETKINQDFEKQIDKTIMWYLAE